MPCRELRQFSLLPIASPQWSIVIGYTGWSKAECWKKARRRQCWQVRSTPYPLIGNPMLSRASIRITGGTGSFGHTFVPMTLAKYNPRRLVIFSRDEMKQWEMAKLYGNDERVRFFIGDVRDKDRLSRALDGIDYVVHAAATKIVPTAAYNPFECVK